MAGHGVLLPGRVYFVTLSAPGKEPHPYRGGWCPCTTDENKLDDPVALAMWNGRMVPRWNRLHQALERRLGCEVEYFRAVEVQKRGALHLHVLLRFDQPVRLRKSTLKALAIRHGFGHEVDVQPADERAARYCAKYVSKSSDDRELAPYVHPRTGEFGPGRWRTWVASRQWGLTMKAVRAAQAAWWREAAGKDGEAGEPDEVGPPAATAGSAALDLNSVRYTSGGIVWPVAVELPLS